MGAEFTQKDRTRTFFPRTQIADSVLPSSFQSKGLPICAFSRLQTIVESRNSIKVAATERALQKIHRRRTVIHLVHASTNALSSEPGTSITPAMYSHSTRK